MIDWGSLAKGLLLLADWQIPLVVAAGMLFGLIVGVIPGMTSALGLAIVLPLTFKMDPFPALMLLTSVYTGALTGGGILAILINTPGTPGAVATTFDGYPMARKGLHNEALGIQITASVIGGLIGYLVLLLFIQPMVWLALQFGPSEMLFLTILVLVIVGVLEGKYLSRALFAGLLGLMLATIGTSTATGEARGTFGIDALEDGLPLVLCIIGMFAIPELIQLVSRRSISEADLERAHDFGKLAAGVGTTFAAWRTWLRGSFLGVGIGLLPAAGATLASLLSYAMAKRRARPEQKFGEGEPEGVVAAESANNATEGGAMGILLALGIPGSASTAVILGGFMLHGLVPGARLLRDNGPFVYALVVGNIFQMLVLGFFTLLVAYYVARVVLVPSRALVPILIVVMTLGAFSFRNQVFDVYVLYAFGLLGWLMRRYQFPLVSLMIGLFLGRQLDEEFVRFRTLFVDNPAALLERPISIVFIVLILTTLALQVRRSLRARRASG
ncbi:MAG: tripartite tricarboxylate transporter permease [Hyphomicrobiaceae bacterium]